MPWNGFCKPNLVASWGGKRRGREEAAAAAAARALAVARRADAGGAVDVREVYVSPRRRGGGLPPVRDVPRNGKVRLRSLSVLCYLSLLRTGRPVSSPLAAPATFQAALRARTAGVGRSLDLEHPRVRPRTPSASARPLPCTRRFESQPPVSPPTSLTSTRRIFITLISRLLEVKTSTSESLRRADGDAGRESASLQPARRDP